MHRTSKKVLNKFDFAFVARRIGIYPPLGGRSEPCAGGGARIREVQTTVTKLVLTAETFRSSIFRSVLELNDTSIRARRDDEKRNSIACHDQPDASLYDF